MEAIYWASIIILVLLVAASIWLLAKGSGNICDTKNKLNQDCTETGDCNCGLVCSPLLGGSGVCKVGSGGVCESSGECAFGLSCQNGICLGQAGKLNDPCPCGEGLTCINSVCKVKVGGPCQGNADCADSQCIMNVCTVVNPNLMTMVQAAQAAGITNLTDLIAANNNNNCTDSDCDCNGGYNHKKHKRNRYSDDSKYYYSDSCSKSSDTGSKSSSKSSSKSCSKSGSKYTKSKYTDSKYTKSHSKGGKKHCKSTVSSCSSKSSSDPCYSKSSSDPCYSKSSTSTNTSTNTSKGCTDTSEYTY